MVRKASNYGASDALRLNVIDAIAPTLPALLNQIDGTKTQPKGLVLHCTIAGTQGPDILRGTPGRDVICGLGGNDVVYGGGGEDIVQAGPGDDVVYGGSGNDVIYGGSGRDRLFGQGGRDKLVGGDGANVLAGGSGDDTILGGFLSDTIVGGPGRDTILAGSGNDISRALEWGVKHIEQSAPISFVGTGPNLNAATENGLTRASDLLKMTVPEVKNRATITGGIEIGRHPGVVHVTFRAPLDRLERIGLLPIIQEQYGTL